MAKQTPIQKYVSTHLCHWNLMYGLLEEPVTHKLDYIPESWIVTQFSSLDPSVIYDTQGLIEFTYTDRNKLLLTQKSLKTDFADFPVARRNWVEFICEYDRVGYMKHLLCPTKHRDVGSFKPLPTNVFLVTNRLFLNHRILKTHRRQVRAISRWGRNKILFKRKRSRFQKYQVKHKYFKWLNT